MTHFMKQTIITNSYEETQKLGADFAQKFNSIPVLALYGDLGSGKTTFIQGLAKGLGIEKKIISPTFIIMRTYEANLRTFYHVDLYRIKDEKDIRDLGLIELMQDPQNLFAIEWPEKVEKILPKKRINLYFTYLEDNKRQIIIT